MIPTTAKILIVDDISTVRSMIRTQLKSLGLENVSDAIDGQEGYELLEKSEKSGQKFELIISDWNMPKMNGFELLKKLRGSKSWKNIPFLLLTSESDASRMTEAIVAGVSQFIYKPFSADQFADKVNQTWQKHQNKAS
jgi:two-component system chemotaxis response regulator CheY